MQVISLPAKHSLSPSPRYLHHPSRDRRLPQGTRDGRALATKAPSARLKDIYSSLGPVAGA